MTREKNISLGILACVLVSLLLVPAFGREQSSESVRMTEGRVRELAQEMLAGKRVRVRVYNNWQADPRAYEIVNVPLDGLSVRFDTVKQALPDISKSAVIVLAAEDQNEQVLALVVADSICVERCKEKGSFSIWPRPHDTKDPKWWTFNDALGVGIPKASVEIFVRGTSDKDPRIFLRKTATDEQGLLEMSHLFGDLRQFSFVFSHADYGICNIDRYLHDQSDLVVPLVHKATEAYQRSIRGTVVDSKGKPVGGAIVRCYNVRTLGEGLINSLHGWAYETLTDKEGAFSLYLPNENRKDERGYLIPPKSKYHVRIEAPNKLGLLPHVEPIENGKEALIILEPGNNFRTFVFEDTDGPITDPNKLRQINLTLNRPDGGRLTFGYSDLKDGGLFPPGEYRATTGIGTEGYNFEPMQVSHDSPEELVFKLSDSILYYGQVVHGLTGESMAGAFVIGMNSKASGNLSMITAEQWQAMHALPADPCLDDPALKQLHKIYGFNRIVRTDERGWFEMGFRPGGQLYGFVAFEENYLGLMHRKHALKPDENRYAKVPTMKLFPAATVFVEPRVDQKRLSIWPRWVIDENDNSVWVREFLATDDRKESLFTYDSWLKPNQAQSFHIPAGLSLRVKLDTPYDRQWCPIDIPKVINVAQGQVLDLGRHDFKPTLEVSVKVVNSLGQTVEGVPVRMLRDGKIWSVAHNADESGVSRFNVIPDSEGQFGVSYHGEGGVNLRETISYRIEADTEAGREFVLQLSDQMLYHLFK
ncbi:MAG: hypothetical protein AMJ75_05920 [Phycisphaerae bacterium SM1_79]|nr:MAG: hypothetical protein AMJ75_05920 [Phycisphaerae bacterium SM1_79]